MEMTKKNSAKKQYDWYEKEQEKNFDKLIQFLKGFKNDRKKI